MRGMSKENLKDTMLIGVSSSGKSENICLALNLAIEKGCKALLISAKKCLIKGSYNSISLDVDEYHTGEVLTLALFYQLIHGSGFQCPTISESEKREIISDYTMS